MNSALSRLSDRALLVFVLAALTAPLVDRIVRPGGVEDVAREFRGPTQPPALPKNLQALTEFPRRFDTWWGDTFGLRGLLLRMRSRLIWSLGGSPSNSIVHGRDDWVFLTRSGAIENSLGMMPLSELELTEWELEIEARRDLCRSFGSEYIMFLVPRKGRVYPDKLPAGLTARGPSRLEQFCEHLGAAGLPVVSHLPVMQAAVERDTEQNQAYWKLGTHWTDRGSFSAALDLLKRLNKIDPRIAPFARERMRLRPGSDQQDSWASRLYLDGQLTQPVMNSVFLPHLQAGKIGRGDLTEGRLWQFEGAGPKDLSAWISHDSFGAYILRIVTESFGSVTALQAQEPDFADAEAKGVDLFLEYYVSGYLVRFSADLAIGDLPKRWEAVFEANAERAVKLSGPGVGRRSPLLPGPRAEVRRGANGTLELEGTGRFEVDSLGWPDSEARLLAFEFESDRPRTVRVSYRRYCPSSWLKGLPPARFTLQVAPGLSRHVVYLPNYRMVSPPRIEILEDDPDGAPPKLTLRSLQRLDAPADQLLDDVRRAR